MEEMERAGKDPAPPNCCKGSGCMAEAGGSFHHVGRHMWELPETGKPGCLFQLLLGGVGGAGRKS